VKIYIMEFRVSTAWGLVGGVKSFEDMYSDFFFQCAGVFCVKETRNIFLRNVVTYLTNYTASHKHRTEVKRPQRESNHLAVSSVVINLSIFISTPKACVHDTVHRHTF